MMTEGKGLPSGLDAPRPPGLISREIIDADDEFVTIREIWDPRIEGCPLLVFKRWTLFEKEEGVESVTRTFKCPHYGDKPDLP